jgi:hypothetical protein
MPSHPRFHSFGAFLVALGLGIAWLQVPTSTAGADATLPEWTGGVNLYRDGTFTTQKSWLWCTAAGVQIVHNLVEGKSDHSTRAQRRYFEWMRDRNRYDLPVSAGVDPAGWTAGLRHFVDDRYRLVASRTFDSALRAAVTSMRLTSLPVALTVAHGTHGWILNGFRATADPAETTSFTVTSVRVTGPLYGLQSKNGYDMAPNTKLTQAQLKRFFTPWKYAPKAMVWDGRFVSIQPVPVMAAPAPAGIAPTTSTPQVNEVPAPTPFVQPGTDRAATASPSIAVAAGIGNERDAPVPSRRADAVSTSVTITDGSFPVPILVATVFGLLAFPLLVIGLARRRT